MSNTEHELPNQENKNSKEKTFFNALGSKMVWDKAGTGFSIPYQKPSQTKRLYHSDAIRESNERLGIKPTNSDSSSSEDNSIEITFLKKK